MAAVDDVDELIEQYHRALDEFLKGNPKPVWKLHTHRDDVSLHKELLRVEGRPSTATPQWR
jgi:hypothetical protein